MRAAASSVSGLHARNFRPPRRRLSPKVSLRGPFRSFDAAPGIAAFRKPPPRPAPSEASMPRPESRRSASRPGARPLPKLRCRARNRGVPQAAPAPSPRDSPGLPPQTGRDIPRSAAASPAQTSARNLRRLRGRVPADAPPVPLLPCASARPARTPGRGSIRWIAQACALLAEPRSRGRRTSSSTRWCSTRLDSSRWSPSHSSPQLALASFGSR
jgi:hypothetical protein